LGCVLINPDSFFEVSAFLRPDDFYLHKHRWIWNAFVGLHEQRLPIDIITVSEELERHSQLGEAGGAAYLTRLINTVPTSLHAEAYGRLVEREAMRRRLIEAATQVAKLAYEEDRDIGEVVNDAEAAVFAVSERRLNKDMAPIKEAISQYYDRIKYLFEHRDELLGVPTGFIDLDKLLGGMQQSDLIIIAGRPGAGKTGFMLNVAKNSALTYKKHVAIFSLEMSNDQLVQRLIAQETGIDSQRLRLGDIHDHEWPLFVQASNVLSEAQIFLDDTPALTPNQLRSKCRRLDQEYGLDLVIVDYLQLMQGDGRTENRVQEVSVISRGLKQLARELNVPVLAGAQLSRAVEQRQDKVPQLSDLRESGCLTGDTLVALASGERVPIRELVGAQPEVVTLDGWKVATAQATRVWLTGHRPVFRLTTRMGRVIRATGNHPFRLLDGWRALDELAVGDRIALPRHYPESASAQSWPEERIVLLAHLIGDGCFASRNPLHYTSASEANLAAVAQAVERAFGVKPKRVAQENWFHLYLSAGANKWHPNPIRLWLRELGIDGQRSPEKHVPAPVFTLSDDQVALFLRHLWSTDGSIYLRRTTHGQTGTVYYATTSERLAKDVQHLLARLGIPSRILTARKQNYRPGYQIHVTGQTDQLEFARRIGAHGERQAALDQLVAFLGAVKANPNRDTVPREVWGRVKTRMGTLGITQRKMAALRGTAYGGDAHFGFAPARATLLDYATRLEDPVLAEIAQSDVYWDTVASVEPDGEADVYDMTVPVTHNFVANGLVVHNSLEQDSDIVMFIHRPDMYEKEGSRTNIAEILVRKHRNGPTADVQLVFRGALTKFENAETRHVDLRNA
jgi:replicative DNA helicase